MALPVFRAASTAKYTNGSAVPPPTGIQAGDLDILITFANISGGGLQSITGGSNYQEFISYYAGGAGSQMIRCWWRIYQVTDTDPTLVLANQVVMGMRLAIQAGTFDTTTPFEIVSTRTDTNNNTTFSWPPFGTTGGADRLVHACYGITRDSNTASTPACTDSSLANVAGRYNFCTNVQSGIGFGITEGQATNPSGQSVGTFACTYLAASIKSSCGWAIRPYVASPYRETEANTTGTSDTNIASGATKIADYTLSNTSGTNIAGNAICKTDASTSGTSGTNVNSGLVVATSFTLNNTSTAQANTTVTIARSLTLANTSTAQADTAWREARTLTLNNTSTAQADMSAFWLRQVSTTGTSSTTINGAIILPTEGSVTATSTTTYVSGATKIVEASTTGTSTTQVNIEDGAGTGPRPVDANTTGTSDVTGVSGATAGTQASATGTSTAIAYGVAIWRTQASTTATSSTTINSGRLLATQANTTGASMTTMAGNAIQRVTASTTGTSATTVGGNAICRTSASTSGTSTANGATSATAATTASAAGSSSTGFVTAALWSVLVTAAGLVTTSVYSNAIHAVLGTAVGTSVVTGQMSDGALGETWIFYAGQVTGSDLLVTECTSMAAVADTMSNLEQLPKTETELEIYLAEVE